MAKRTAGPIRVTLRYGVWWPPKARKKRSTDWTIEPWKSADVGGRVEPLAHGHEARLGTCKPADREQHLQRIASEAVDPVHHHALAGALLRATDQLLRAALLDGLGAGHVLAGDDSSGTAA